MYTRSVAILHENERVSLKNLLLQYQGILSKNDEVINHTDIIQHSIDTGNVHPIRKKPRLVPLS